MTIENVSRETFDRLRGQLLQTHQAYISGTDEGIIDGNGVTAKYHYDVGHKTLFVEVVHHPFFVTISAIEGHLREAVTKASA